jgi:hypothetical protein
MLFHDPMAVFELACQVEQHVVQSVTRQQTVDRSKIGFDAILSHF